LVPAGNIRSLTLAAEERSEALLHRSLTLAAEECSEALLHRSLTLAAEECSEALVHQRLRPECSEALQHQQKRKMDPWCLLGSLVFAVSERKVKARETHDVARSQARGGA